MKRSTPHLAAFARAAVAEGAKAAPTFRVRGVEALPKQDPAANLTIDVKYSCINYKDAMVLAGQPGVAEFPVVAGIDAAGVVVAVDESPVPENNGLGFQPGDEVVITGNKIGQKVDGGLATRCRVQAGWALKKPPTLSLWDTMALGSAGITAMMCIRSLEQHGGLEQFKGTSTPVLVTGAGGGLGGISIRLLSNMGYRVVASTRRVSELQDYLKSLGADEVVGGLEPSGPLGKQRWGGVIDAVGGQTLAAALSQTKYRCAVASTGVAGGGDLATTVYPFILRGVHLLGVDSTLPWNCPGYDTHPAAWEAYRQERAELWRLLAVQLGPDPTLALKDVVLDTIPLAAVTPQLADDLLSGRVRGRYVVDVQAPPSAAKL